LGFSQAEIKLAKNLVSHDTLGQLAIRNIDPELGIATLDAYKKLKTLAADSDMDLDDFFELQKLFFTSDAASYEFIRLQSFVAKENLLVPVSPDFQTLKNLIFLGEQEELKDMNLVLLELWAKSHTPKKSILGSTSRPNDLDFAKLPSCCITDPPFSIPTELQTDTVAGAIDKISLAQKSEENSDLAKAYHQIRSTNPQTFSKQTLGEIVQHLDDLVKNNYVHATNYRVLPNLRLTQERAGIPALMPQGVLKEKGLVAGSGELGIGSIGEQAHNVGFLSGFSYVSGNIDTAYHYARLKGSYNLKESQVKLSKLKQAIKQAEAALPGTDPTNLRLILRDDFGIFDSRLLFERTLTTAKTTLQREKAFVKQIKQFSPLETSLIQEGKPLIITARKKVKNEFVSIRGEVSYSGSVSLADPDAVVFVERSEIPRVTKYLQEQLGIKNPKVRSLESYDLFYAITDSYQHGMGGGTFFSPENFRFEIQDDPEGLRLFLKQQIKNYIATMK